MRYIAYIKYADKKLKYMSYFGEGWYITLGVADTETDVITEYRPYAVFVDKPLGVIRLENSVHFYSYTKEEAILQSHIKYSRNLHGNALAGLSLSIWENKIADFDNYVFLLAHYECEFDAPKPCTLVNWLIYYADGGSFSKDLREFYICYGVGMAKAYTLTEEGKKLLVRLRLLR